MHELRIEGEDSWLWDTWMCKAEGLPLRGSRSMEMEKDKTAWKVLSWRYYSCVGSKEKGVGVGAVGEGRA